MSRRLEESYVEFGQVEEAFLAALDESLAPRSPELLYELVERLGLPEGSFVVDSLGTVNNLVPSRERKPESRASMREKSLLLSQSMSTPSYP